MNLLLLTLSFLVTLLNCPVCCNVHSKIDIHPQYHLHIDSSLIAGNLTHFWRSTGFCPPAPHRLAYKFDLGNDMLQNLAYIGAVPFSGIKQVRIHWLLDLVQVDSFQNGKASYDWSKLDKLIEVLHNNGLKPGFELMGNPSGLFTDFEKKTELYMWRSLIEALAVHYIDIYGIDWIETWNFETWNEPDCRDFDDVRMTVQGFLNYYDACSEGLKAASPRLKFGGPGDGCNSHRVEYSQALLTHIVNGTNYFTGAKGVRIDFLSFHRKGNGTSGLILNDELKTVAEIHDMYPQLADKPFYNDEADPLVGWSKPEWWRADVTYAAIVAKIIAQHQNIILANESSPIHYVLLSNDNAFMSWYPNQFTERTLLARFQMNNTKMPYTNFVRKPVHSVMGLLALLGDTQVPAYLTDVFGHPVSNKSEVGVLASVHLPLTAQTSDSWQMSVLVYSSNDTEPPVYRKQTNISVWLDFRSPAGTEYILAKYSINNDHTNPYKVWLEMGHPDFPSQELFSQMRKQEDPVLVDFRRVKGSVFVPLTLYQPEVTVFHICAKSKFSPEQVINVDILNITVGKVLVTWSDEIIQTHCLLTYDVMFSKSHSGPFVKINENRSVYTAYVYAPVYSSCDDDPVRGYYQVRAVDYWNRAGPFSLLKPYPS